MSCGFHWKKLYYYLFFSAVTCPAYDDDVSYTIGDYSTAMDSDNNYADTTTVTITCADGYSSESTNNAEVATCTGGVWAITEMTCVGKQTPFLAGFFNFNW